MPPSRWKDDRKLVRDCQRGDANAWEELIRRYRRLICSIPVAFRFRPDQADEVFQRVALKLFEHLPGLRRAEGLASWIAVTTRRECRAYVQAEARYTTLEGSDPDSLSGEPPDLLDALDSIEREHSLALALERLDEPCRRLLSALYVEEPTPSYKAIAERLRRPVGSLGPTRARCLAKLAKLYRQLGGPEPPSTAGADRSEPVLVGAGAAGTGIKQGRSRSSGEGGGE